MPVSPVQVPYAGNFGAPSTLVQNQDAEYTLRGDKVRTEEMEEQQRDHNTDQALLKQHLQGGGSLATPDDFDAFLKNNGDKMSPGGYLKFVEAKKNMAVEDLKYRQAIKNESLQENLLRDQDQAESLSMGEGALKAYKDSLAAGKSEEEATANFNQAKQQILKQLPDGHKLKTPQGAQDFLKLGPEGMKLMMDHSKAYQAILDEHLEQEKKKAQTQEAMARAQAYAAKGIVPFKDQQGNEHETTVGDHGQFMENGAVVDPAQNGWVRVAAPGTGSTGTMQSKLFRTPDNKTIPLNHNTKDGKFYDTQGNVVDPVAAHYTETTAQSAAMTNGPSLLAPEAISLAVWDHALNVKEMSGMGTMSVKQRADIRNREAQVQEQLGLTPQEWVNLKTNNKARSKALDGMVKWGSFVDKSVGQLVGTIDKAILYSQDLPLGDIQRINALVIAGATEFGSGEAAKYGQMMQSWRTEYARLMSGPTSNAMLPENAQEKADKLISSIASPDQLEGLKEATKAEAEITHKAVQDQVQALQEGMNNPYANRPDGKGPAPSAAGGGEFKPLPQTADPAWRVPGRHTMGDKTIEVNEQGQYRVVK